jgi:hypothetical protein
MGSGLFVFGTAEGKPILMQSLRGSNPRFCNRLNYLGLPITSGNFRKALLDEREMPGGALSANAPPANSRRARWTIRTSSGTRVPSHRRFHTTW